MTKSYLVIIMKNLLFILIVFSILISCTKEVEKETSIAVFSEFVINGCAKYTFFEDENNIECGIENNFETEKLPPLVFKKNNNHMCIINFNFSCYILGWTRPRCR